MKKSLLLFWCLLTGIFTQAQLVNYSTEANNPQDYYPKLNINLLVSGLDGSYTNFDGMYFYSGIHGQYMINQRLGVQWNANRSWFTLGRLGFPDYKPSNDLNAGAVFYLTNSTRTRKVNVVLKSENGKTQGSTVTTSIQVPASRVMQWGLRAGLHRKSVAYGLSDEVYDPLESQGVKHASYKCVALYGGLIKRRLTNVVVNVDGYGRRFNSLGFETYLDAILTVSNKFTLLDPDVMGTSFKQGQDISPEVKNLLKTSPIGFRIGWTGYQIAPKTVTDKKFGASYNFEVGIMPYQGIFVRGGIGLTLVKK